MSIRPLRQDVHAVVLVPCNDRWQNLRQTYDSLRPGMALGCEFLSRNFGRLRLVFLNTGDEAIEAAVSAQYAVDRWAPRRLAFDGAHEAFEHVAVRNGLSLTPVEELWETLEPVAPAEPRKEPADEVGQDLPESQPVHEFEPEESEADFAPDAEPFPESATAADFEPDSEPAREPQ